MSENMFGVVGEIEIELTDKDGNIKRKEKIHNTVTDIGKQFVLADCLQSIAGYSGGGVVANRNYSEHQLYSNTKLLADGNKGALDYIPQIDSTKCLTNVLLNLDQTQYDNLTIKGSSANRINVLAPGVFKATSVDSQLEVVGYDPADSNIVTGLAGVLTDNENIVDTREGKLSTRPDKIIDNMEVSNKYYYAAGIATGIINCVAMMNKAAVQIDRRYSDKAEANKMDIRDWTLVSYARKSQFNNDVIGFLPPGVPGFTTDSEVIIKVNDSTYLSKVNVLTGEITGMAEEGVGYWAPLPACDFYVIGDHAYILVNSGTYYSVKVYNISTGKAIQNPTLEQTFLRPSLDKFVKFYLYNDEHGEHLCLVSESGFGIALTGNNSSTIFPIVNGGMETKGGIDYVRLTSTDRINAGLNSDERITCRAYRPTGLTNPPTAGSLAPGLNNEDVITNYAPQDYLCVTSTLNCLFRLGQPSLITSGRGMLPSKGSRFAVNKIQSDGSCTVENQTSQYGLWISHNATQQGNLFSYKLLDTPIVKEADDLLTITYSYKVV